MTDRELMQQALNALKVMRPACFAETTLKAADTAINALRDRLAQPEQELMIDCPRCGHCCPQRQWVGLTMLDMAELRRSGFHTISDKDFRAIEAKLREKNGG
jgi:Fe-S-cluster containining protein